MAQTNYSKNNGAAVRRPGVMDRESYLACAHELCARGQDLPQSKLLDLDVISIRSEARQRESLREHIRDNLSNAALAKKYGTHTRNIEKILSRQTWCHVL